ncbi:alkaline phosphatase family protein [Amnibacterium sp.]|uniref:alkaline phosphatase family protein n=1 Tax=Amnibacterium sp. TaxID=1872496 RepID=UPI003F7BEAB2
MDRLHVLVVGIDGLRFDLATAERAPHLRGLVARGVTTWMTIPVPTISGPVWATLLTGATAAEHGISDNTFVGSRLAGIPDLLSRAFFADPTRSTFAAAAWPPFVDPAGIGPVIHARDEQRRAERHRVIARDGETYGYRTEDAEIAAFSAAALAGAGPDVSFVYFSGVDEAGHVYGAISRQYVEAISRTDAHLGRLLAAVAERARAGERWLVAVTTDHGHLDGGGHGGGEPEVAASFVTRAAWNVELDAWPDQIEPTELTPRLLAALG